VSDYFFPLGKKERAFLDALLHGTRPTFKEWIFDHYLTDFKDASGEYRAYSKPFLLKRFPHMKDYLKSLREKGWNIKRKRFDGVSFYYF